MNKSETATARLETMDTILGLEIHRDWRVIENFPATHEDGQDVTLSEIALPCKFYRISAASKKFAGEWTKSRVVLETGSGQLRLAREICQAIAGGMLTKGNL